jgi:hypothetical protein
MSAPMCCLAAADPRDRPAGTRNTSLLQKAGGLLSPFAAASSYIQGAHGAARLPAVHNAVLPEVAV